MRLATLFLFACSAWGAGCTGYSYSVEGTFGAVGGAAPISNFPAPIAITSDLLRTTANGGASQSTGYDIAISDINNTTCFPLQIRDYSATTGAYYAVQQVPSIFAVGTQQVLMWVGKAAVSDPSTTSVWATSYKQVYPLQESGSPYNDATSNAKNSTAVTGTLTRVAATVGYAQTFTVASSNKISFNNNSTLAIPATISAMFKLPSASGTNQAIWENRTGNLGGCVIYVAATTGYAEGYCNNGTVSSSVNVADGNWHHMLLVWASTTVLRIYVDGVYRATLTGSVSGVAVAGNTVYIGAAFGPAGFFGGQIQESRSYAGALCTNTSGTCPWAMAEYLAMTSPTTFFALTVPSYGY